LQYLRHGGWVKMNTLPDAPKKISKLMGLGWIERSGSGSDVSFRITDAGLEALKKPNSAAVSPRALVQGTQVSGATH
jgi:hypothetical protein